MKLARIACIGEALVDFKSLGAGGFPMTFTGYAGGSPYNVAVAAARLGEGVMFLGQVSNDMFGQALGQYLEQNGVDTSLLECSAAPSTLGFVEETPQAVRWSFNNLGTADTRYDPQPRPTLPDSVCFLAFGSISLLREPTASSILEIVTAHRNRLMVMFDPNCRPSLSNHAEYHQRFEAYLAQTDILKLSAEDLAWLEPNVSYQEAAQHFLESSPKVVIITLGEQGAVLYRRNAKPLRVMAHNIQVVDTVGAGDTFSAGLMVALLEHGVFRSSELETVSDEILLGAMRFATQAAGQNCRRAGANPPLRAEMEVGV